MADKNNMQADTSAATNAKKDKYSPYNEANRPNYPQIITRKDGTRQTVLSPEEHRDLDKADENMPKNKLEPEGEKAKPELKEGDKGWGK